MAGEHASCGKPHLKTYVKAAVKEDIPKPSTRAFDVIREATRDPLTEVKLNEFLSITKMVTPFLTLYQTYRPMVPFLPGDLHKLLKQFLVRLLKEDVMDSLSLPKLTELDINDTKNHKPTAKIELAFTAGTLLKQLQLSKVSVHIQLYLICKTRHVQRNIIFYIVDY